jgi:hypothetical protein
MHKIKPTATFLYAPALSAHESVLQSTTKTALSANNHNNFHEIPI